MSPSNIEKPSKKRTRVFSIVTYITEKDIQNVLTSHSRSLRSFAYIRHDKDESEPHFHLLIRTYDAWTSTQISKWFDTFKLKDNTNTFVEPANDLYALQEYITHSDYQSIQEGKHRYNIEEVVDGGLFDMIEAKDSYDDTYEIINALLQGVPTKVLIRRYGKKLIYHYSQFMAVKEAIEREEWQEENRKKDIAAGYKVPNLKPIPLDAVSIDDIFPVQK